MVVDFRLENSCHLKHLSNIEFDPQKQFLKGVSLVRLKSLRPADLKSSALLRLHSRNMFSAHKVDKKKRYGIFELNIRLFSPYLILTHISNK